MRGPSPKGAVLAALLALAFWHAGLRRSGLALPMIIDEGEYAYQARLLAAGKVPYRDGYSQKPPLVFFLYRAAFAVFGEDERSPRLLAQVFAWAAMLLLFLLTPPAWGLASRLAGPAAYGVLSTTPAGDLGFVANCEGFMGAFLALAAWALLRSGEPGPRRAFLALAGAACGAALATKQTAVWAVAAFGCYVLWRGRREPKAAVEAAGWFSAGCAVVPAVLAAWFWRRGALAALWTDACARNMDYASVLAEPGAAWAQVSWFGRVVLPALAAPGWPVCALAAAAFARKADGPDSERSTVAVLWLAGALIGAATGLYLFPHYFAQAVAPLAFAAALGTRRLETRSRAAAAAALAVLALYPAVIGGRAYFRWSPERLARELLYPNPLFEAKSIGEELRRRTDPGDRIYVFGSEPQVYFYARRRAATEHASVYPLALFPRERSAVDRELARLEAEPPRFVLYVDQPASLLIASSLGVSFRDGVRELLSKRYRWVESVVIEGEGSRRLEAPGGAVLGEAPPWESGPALHLFEARATTAEGTSPSTTLRTARPGRGDRRRRPR